MLMINEVSRQVNLSQKRIREYEKEGFIRPDREPRTNNRVYTEFEVQQIRRINYLIHERGFTLACLKALLLLSPCWNIFDCREREKCPAYQYPHLPCWQVRETMEARCPGPCTKCAVYINRDQEREMVLEKDYP
ncbi:MAG: helix-turn-helix domain-containing protein [Thermodesulfobacteriota bacterium]